MKRRERVITVLKEIISRDPDSHEAQNAKLRLAEMLENESDEGSNDPDFFIRRPVEDCDEHDVLISPSKWKYMDWEEDNYYQYHSRTTFKTEFKSYLKRKKWLVNDVVSPLIAKEIQSIKSAYLLFYIMKSLWDTIHGFRCTRNLTKLSGYEGVSKLEGYTINTLNKSQFRFNAEYTSIAHSVRLETDTYQTKNPTKKLVQDFLICKVDMVDAKTNKVKISIFIEDDLLFTNTMEIEPDKYFQFWDLKKVTQLKNTLNERAGYYYEQYKEGKTPKNGIKRNSDEVHFDELF